MRKIPAFEKRICPDCGKLRDIREDNPAARCKPCANKRMEIKVDLNCTTCDKTARMSPSRVRTPYFCTQECRWQYMRALRTCKKCGGFFRKAWNTVSGKTNSSANFCSKECYTGFLVKPDRITGRGSRWKLIAKAIRKKHPFCALCGTTRVLDIHHIVPFRLTQDNEDDNLIPLCKKCHKQVEIQTVSLEESAISPCDIKTLMSNLLRPRQLSTLLRLKKLYTEIQDARNSNARSEDVHSIQEQCETAPA